MGAVAKLEDDTSTDRASHRRAARDGAGTDRVSHPRASVAGSPDSYKPGLLG